MDNDAFVSIRDMQWEQPKPVIFVHGDVDGMVTACIFLRARGGDAELRFTGARRIAGDLQALAERIQGGLQVSEVLIGNVPVRPPAVGAVRQLLATDISVTWVDHHNTRQPLLDEIAAFDGVNFLHDAEEAHPSHLAARVLELEDPHIDRLIQIPEGAESDDEWVQSCHTLFSALIGRGRSDVLRRVADVDELTEEDQVLIESHLAREAAAEALVSRDDHVLYPVGAHQLVIIDGRGQDVGFLPRRVDARFPDVALRVMAPDEQTVMVTTNERGRDLVRLLRALPWPTGVFVGGRSYQARIDPGPTSVDAVLEILRDTASWPADIDAAATRQPRERRPRQRSRKQKWGAWTQPDLAAGEDPRRLWRRGFFERMLEQRLVADLMQEAWRRGNRIDVLRAEADDAGYTLLMDSDTASRHVAVFCSPRGADVTQVPIPASLADRPEGCLIWLEVDDNAAPERLEIRYLWYGDSPGYSLPPIDDLPSVQGGDTTFHLLPRDRFTAVGKISALAEKLFVAR